MTERQDSMDDAHGLRHGHGHHHCTSIDRHIVQLLYALDAAILKAHSIHKRMETLMVDSVQLETDLNAIRDGLIKVQVEERTLVDRVATLEAALAAGEISPAAATALQGVKDQLKILDDQVADVVPGGQASLTQRSLNRALLPDDPRNPTSPAARAAAQKQTDSFKGK